MPESAVVAEEVAEGMPESAVVVEEAVEAMPESAVVAEEVAEAMSESAVVVEEAVEAMPESAVVAEEVAEAMPESAVVAEEAVEEVAEAVPASGVVFDDEIGEAMPESAVVAEEAAETSSATRKAEAVLGEEVGTAEAVSGIEEAEAVEAGSSAVVFDDMPMGGTDAKKKTADDELATDEEVAAASEASAVDLGDIFGKKGSSVTGIDKVAEALESGVDLGAPPQPESGVEFDEAIEEDLAEAEETGAPIAGKGKNGKNGKNDKKKSPTQEIGADIDLNDLFGEQETAEAAEAVDGEGTEELTGEEAVAFDEPPEAEDADEAEAEAAEAFNEEVEAAESTEDDELADFDADEKPATSKTKMGKKTSVDDEQTVANEEEVSAKKKGKKGKKEKEKATVAATSAAAGYGCLSIVIAMVLLVVLIGAGAGAGWWFAPDQIRDFAKMSDNSSDKPIPPKAPTPLEKANASFARADYPAVIAALPNPAKPEEFNVRGQARWFAYAADAKKKNAALDIDAPAVKDALDDLGEKKGNNPLLAEHIRDQSGLPGREKDLNDKLAKANMDKDAVAKELTKVANEKDDANKKVDGLADVLAKEKIIEDKTKLDAAVVQKTLQELNADKITLATVNKLLKGAEIKGAGKEGVEEIIKLRKEADESVAAVNKALEDANIKEKGDKGVIDIAKARKEAIDDRDDLLKTVKAAFKEFIDGKIVPENADARKMIVGGAKLARQKAESPLSIPLAQLGMSLGGIGSGTSKVVEKSFDIAKVFTELGYFRSREPFIQTPEQKMDTHMALLANRKRNDAKELAAITREADWVLSKESKADAESRSKARFVQGLALRNLEKFAEARTAFDDSLDRLKPLDKAAPWSQAVTVARSEITDPTVYYIPRIETYRAEQNYKASLDEANTALKAMPGDARLFAQRGLTRLEAVRGLGAKIPDAAQKEIRADAAAAAKNDKVVADSAHLVGMLEESLQNWPEAEKNYREALKLHQGPPEDAGKYRISLARLLLRERTANPVVAPAQPDEKKNDDTKDEKKDGKVGQTPTVERTIVWHPWSTLIAAAIIAQPDDDIDDKETLARVNETIKLAQELINSKNDKLKGQGYMLMGSALSKVGKRTEGLKEYAKGLKLVYPGIETKEIETLINEHPAFAQPDIAGTSNPVMAERHFGEGIHLYWSRDFEKAEAQFKTAVKYYDRDARYQYFLGLSQLAQKSKAKRDAAYYSFEVGARLEAKSVSTNPYAARDINMSLERIQGPVRELLNSYRFKALDPEADAKAPAQ